IRDGRRVHRHDHRCSRCGWQRDFEGRSRERRNADPVRAIVLEKYRPESAAHRSGFAGRSSGFEQVTFDVITIFPEFFKGPFDFGVIRRGREKGLVDIRVHDLRDFTSDRHRTVDDRPFGGGEGMVFKAEPIFKAVETVRREAVNKDESPTLEVVVLSAAGRPFNQAEALRLSKADQVILICGRYEGIDERVVEHLATAEISVGDFILSGGEIAALVVVDAVTRYVPGVVGKEESILRDSFSDR